VDLQAIDLTDLDQFARGFPHHLFTTLRHVVGAVGYGSGLVRCSISANQAITNGSNGPGIVGPVLQIQLSTGRVSAPTWLPTTPPLSGLQLSGNGDFAAVS
jgi:hypothetical protein